MGFFDILDDLFSSFGSEDLVLYDAFNIDEFMQETATAFALFLFLFEGVLEGRRHFEIILVAVLIFFVDDLLHFLVDFLYELQLVLGLVVRFGSGLLFLFFLGLGQRLLHESQRDFNH